MKEFPSCFGENGVAVADFSSTNATRAAHNMVNCVYRCKFRGKSFWVTITWSKNLMGQGLTVGIGDNSNQCLCKVDIKPWLFSKKKGSKSLGSDSGKINIFWDFSSAKFGFGPEPLEGFYVAIVFGKQMILLLGDMRREAFKKTGSIPSLNNSVFVSKREHIFGKKSFATKARVNDNGRTHDLAIECDTSGLTEPCLAIRVDSKQVMQVKRLRWKFRGNGTILVDGVEVQVFWDVHNWLFGNSLGNAVFMFKSRVSSDKLWPSRTLYDVDTLDRSWTQRFEDSEAENLGFSLILHAWKNE